MKAIVGRKLVVACCYPPTLFDLVEEPLDQVASAVQIRAKADRLVAISSRRDVGPNTPFGGEGSDPISVIVTVCQQH
jgi:hypothetical protein